MDRKRLIVIVTILSALVFLSLVTLFVVKKAKSPEAAVEKHFENDLNNPDFYTAEYLSFLKKEEDSGVDTQTYKDSYSNVKTTKTFQKVENLQINGETATCEATAYIKTIFVGEKDFVEGYEKYRFELIIENGKWKISNIKLLDSQSNIKE